jgi:hypothetical protein
MHAIWALATAGKIHWRWMLYAGRQSRSNQCAFLMTAYAKAYLRGNESQNNWMYFDSTPCVGLPLTSSSLLDPSLLAV